MPQLPAIVLEGLSDAQKQALRIADNKLALNATWDDDLLRAELAELRDLDFNLELTGFGEDELLGIFADRNSGLTDPDDVPEAPTEPVTQPGDVWLLGRHRLVCGSATSQTDHALAVADAEIDAVVTDPPYGVGIAYDTFDDNETDVRELIEGFMPLVRQWPIVAFTSGHRMMWDYPKPTWMLAWVHPAGMGSGPWGFTMLNPILVYGADPYLKRRLGGRGDVLVLAADREDQKGHPVAKPVDAWKWLVERVTTQAGTHVLDPFVGSGTTIIAAEMTGRACHAIEISPAYCDVTIQRWQNFTGNTATRPDGTPFQAACRATVSAD